MPSTKIHYNQSNALTSLSVENYNNRTCLSKKNYLQVRQCMNSKSCFTNENKKAQYEKFLTKTEIRKRTIFKKTVLATEYLNGKYGVGKWRREWLCNKVNLYLKKDNHKTLSLSQYDRYRRELNNLVVEEVKPFSCIGSGLGLDHGATFVCITHKDALRIINKYFYSEKMMRQKHKKMMTQRYKKVMRHTVYCFNQLNQSISTSAKSKTSESLEASKIEHRQKRTDSFSRNKGKGSYACQKALKSLETVGILESDLRILNSKIYHPITRENALINLSHFIGEFEPKDARKAFEHYKHELIHYASNIGSTRRGEPIYEKALGKVRDYIVKATKIAYKSPVPYIAPTGKVDLEPVEITNPVLRELMERLGKQIEARESIYS